MSRRLVLAISLTFVLVGMLSVAARVQRVEASGTVYIRADGSVEGTTYIESSDNVTYVFTADINDSIVIERSNIIINGSGYTLQGSGRGSGFYWNNINNVTIKRTSIKSFDYGILLSYSSGNSIYENVFVDDGLVMQYSYGNIVENNLVNGKPLVYWEDASNLLIEDAGQVGQVILVNCSSITIRNLNLSYTTIGVELCQSNNITITNNNITANNHSGIWLEGSSGNIISGNNITANNWYGILLESSGNNNISGNNIANNLYGIGPTSSRYNNISGNNIANNLYGIRLDLSRYNNISGNSFVNNGLVVLTSSYGNVVSDNLVNGKPLVYLEDVSDRVVEGEAGQVVLVKCSRIRVENLSSATFGVELWETNSTQISGNNVTNGEGIVLRYSSNNTISGNNITANDHGILLRYSSNNTISGNNITASNWAGIALDFSSNNSISGNNIANNYQGIGLSLSSNNSISGNNITTNKYAGFDLRESSNNSISGNNIANNWYGMQLYFFSNNSIYHNNFIDNARQVYFYGMTSGYPNRWDNGYPSGGNYWSNYTGRDVDGDGIGDTSYMIDVNNTDHYPLMGMFSDFEATTENHVQTICNSTISYFKFNDTAVLFNVTGVDGTAGFCRICIPKALISGTYRVFINGTEILPAPEPLPCSNTTHTYLYFSYSHSTQEVIVIPEFPTFLILPLIMIATLLAAIVYRLAHFYCDNPEARKLIS